MRHQGAVTNAVAREALDLMEIDEEGLEGTDRELLHAIAFKFDGGPVGLSTLAVTLGEETDTIEDVYEPYLLQLGFLQRTPRGRVITKLGRVHIGGAALGVPRRRRLFVTDVVRRQARARFGGVSHPELKAEQAYVDHAYECLERMREIVLRAGDAADGEVAQAALDAWAAKRLATFEDAERGLMFGRLDFEAVERALYVGRRWVHDDEGEQIVVNWQAPAARPFYTATPQDPQRVTLRRRFRAQGRRLVDIADEALDGSTLDGASVGDFLLEELERSRDTYMRDIVATIQADQYRLITREPVRPLVIQGGPGTGKTAVGLHRASWLIYTEREKNARSRVLVVGPNRTFMEYVSHVLPALGEGSVEQLAVSELVAGVEPTLRRHAGCRPPEGGHAHGGRDRPCRGAAARRRARRS